MVIFILLSACSSENKELNQISKDLEEIHQNTERIKKQLRIIDCEAGLLIAFRSFNNLLYKKVTKKQLYSAFEQCEAIVL